MKQGYYATTHPKTKQFMEELHALFTKHDLAVVPTHEGALSFHDHLLVVPYSEGGTESFIERTTFEEDEPEEEGA